jgi:hypothetical protein
MPDDRYVRGKDKDELLADLVGTGEVGSPVHEQQKVAILVRIGEDLEAGMDRLRQSIDQAASSSESLGRRVFWLNLVLIVATTVGAFAALWSAFS